jgi:hypothetical protein
MFYHLERRLKNSNECMGIGTVAILSCTIVY